MKLSYKDHRKHPSGFATELGISLEAAELYLASEIVDLHVDSFIWTRIFGYDLTKRHGHGPFGARFFHQVDLPRLREAQIGGALWSITTNPLRTARGRESALHANVSHLRSELARCAEDVAVVSNAREYRSARERGLHAAVIVVQGGNALDVDETALDRIHDDVIALVTLVHLSTSSLGRTSSPARGGGPDTGLTTKGKDFVKRLNARRMFVDLAHVSRQGFFDAVKVHDASQPLISSHTGVAGVTKHWRNLEDSQLRAIAETGGVVGVMYQSTFLGGGLLGCKASLVVDHLEHIVNTVGEDVPALGSDWDGMIVPPRDLPTCLELARLVQLMLERGWNEVRIRKILGGNFLRAFSVLRP